MGMYDGIDGVASYIGDRRSTLQNAGVSSGKGSGNGLPCEPISQVTRL